MNLSQKETSKQMVQKLKINKPVVSPFICIWVWMEHWNKIHNNKEHNSIRFLVKVALKKAEVTNKKIKTKLKNKADRKI